MYERYSNMQVAGPMDRTSAKVCPKFKLQKYVYCWKDRYYCIIDILNNYSMYLYVYIQAKSFHKLFEFFNYRFAFQYNPSLQPRALVVFGCISKRVSHGQIKQIIRILSKVLPLLFPNICGFQVVKYILNFSKGQLNLNLIKYLICCLLNL